MQAGLQQLVARQAFAALRVKQLQAESRSVASDLITAGRTVAAGWMSAAKAGVLSIEPSLMERLATKNSAGTDNILVFFASLVLDFGASLALQYTVWARSGAGAQALFVRAELEFAFLAKLAVMACSFARLSSAAIHATIL